MEAQECDSFCLTVTVTETKLFPGVVSGISCCNWETLTCPLQWSVLLLAEIQQMLTCPLQWSLLLLAEIKQMLTCPLQCSGLLLFATITDANVSPAVVSSLPSRSSSRIRSWSSSCGTTYGAVPLAAARKNTPDPHGSVMSQSLPLPSHTWTSVAVIASLNRDARIPRCSGQYNNQCQINSDKSTFYL